MLFSLWHSFVEAVALGHDRLAQGGGGSLNCMVGEPPLPHEAESGCLQEQAGSKAALKHRGVTYDPDVSHVRTHHNVVVEELGTDSEEEFQDSWEELPSRGLVVLPHYFSWLQTQLSY